MRILVACEESQAVCKAFRARGHKAFSCDIMPCSGGHPEWHIQGDVLPLLDQEWDMIIAFPPCTYLSNVGSLNLHKSPESGNKIVSKEYLNPLRMEKAKLAKSFFMSIFNNKCSKIAIENPTPAKIHGLPIPSQIIQPFDFGHEYSKRTCLWLKGLPPLMATDIRIKKDCWVKVGHNSVYGKTRGIQTSAFMKSKTFKGIADAMAEQWGGLNADL